MERSCSCGQRLLNRGAHGVTSRPPFGWPFAVQRPELSGTIDAKMKYTLTVLALLLLPPLALAQNWKATTQTDPMTDKTYPAFALQGNGVEESFTATIGLFCNGGKFMKAGLTVDGMTFHQDSYAALRNPPFVTYAKVRTETKVELKAFLVSQGMSVAEISSQELEKMVKAGTVTIQFSDAFSKTHYVRFDGMTPSSEMTSACGMGK